MPNSYSGVGWLPGTWSINLEDGPQGAAWDAWLADKLGAYTSGIVNRGAASSVSSFVLRFTSAHVEWVQGDRSFDDLGAAINYIRLNFNKPCTLVWSDVTFGNNASRYPSTAPWMTANGWRNTAGWSGVRSNLRIYNSAAQAWLLSATSDFVDWVRTGTIAPGVNTRDWVTYLQIADETAPGNFRADPQYSDSGYAAAITAWVEAARVAAGGASRDLPIAAALNFFPTNQQPAYREYLRTNNIIRGMPDGNVFQTLKSTVNNAWGDGSGNVDAVGQYGTHAYSKFTHDVAGYIPMIQTPQYYNLEGDWNHANGLGIPGAKSSQEATNLSNSRGGHPGGSSQLPWPDVDFVPWAQFMRYSGVIIQDYPSLRAEIASAIIQMSPLLPFGPNPYDDAGGGGPALLSAPFGINCNGVEGTFAGVPFTTLPPPGDMGQKVVTETVLGTDYQPLFSGMWRWNTSSTDGTLVLLVEQGTYSVLFPTCEVFHPTDEREYNIRVQGTLLAGLTSITPFADGGGRLIASQRRVDNIVVGADNLLTIRFELGTNGAYSDHKPEIPMFAVIANLAADPGFVAATSSLKPITPTNLQLLSRTTSEIVISFDEITLAP